MNNGHYEDWELFEYLDAKEDGTEFAVVAEHVEGCDRCASLLDEITSFVQILKDEDVHETPSPLERDVRDAQALALRIQAEDAEGADVLGRLRLVPLEEWDHVLLSEPNHAGVIRALITEARSLYEKRPGSALSVLATTEKLANGLTDVYDLAYCRGSVAKERANVLRFLSRYAEALIELEHARQFIQHLPVQAFDLALIEWSQATVLFAMTRYADALSSVRSAMRTLWTFGDTTRAKQAAILEAGILHEQGQLDDALERYLDLRQYFDTEDDTARLLTNIADCELRLGRLDASQSHASLAGAAWEKLGNVTERGRVEWMLGTIELRRGNLAAAETALNDVRNTFVELGMRSEAGEVLLDLVQIYVLQSRWSDAADAAARAAQTFIEIDAPVHIADALQYLRSSIDAQRATASLVQYVSKFVGDAARRDVTFTPPSGASVN
jgi:tetratricopeptide (TPR) repeat protein